MKKVIYRDQYYNQSTSQVKDYVEEKLYKTADGSLEEVEANSLSTQEALARLVETLLDKGIISIKELGYIAEGRSHADIEIVEAEK